MSQYPVTQLAKHLQSHGFKRTANGVYGIASIISMTLLGLLAGLAFSWLSNEVWGWLAVFPWMIIVLLIPYVPAAVAILAVFHFGEGEAFKTQVKDTLACLAAVLVATGLVEAAYLMFRALHADKTPPWASLPPVIPTIAWILGGGIVGFCLRPIRVGLQQRSLP